LTAQTEHLLRELTPKVLGSVARHFGDFHAAEDAVQEALLAAAAQWPTEGIPENPRGWLVRVASRRMIDHQRSESARRQRETRALHFGYLSATENDADADRDDSLVLLFMCAHPALSASSAIALTLRAVGGLTTAQIANAFLVPETTMAQRISRAKQSIRESGSLLQLPSGDEWNARLRSVLHVLYLIFNEGYVTSTGTQLQVLQLSREAIRLTRMLAFILPKNGDVMGLLALMLLNDARRLARTGHDGELIPLSKQDRGLWDTAEISEGVALVSSALTSGSIGVYQIQAAIAAVHDEAASVEETDWKQILALYDVLKRISDNPMVELNRAIAVAMVHGAAAGLDSLDELRIQPQVARHHRLDAVRAHLLEMAGDRAGAIRCFRRASERTGNAAERNYLQMRAAELADGEVGDVERP
jgi:RNA polymerase sigma factor (sigma-70 family)